MNPNKLIHNTFQDTWNKSGGFLTSNDFCASCNKCETDNIYILPQEFPFIIQRHGEGFPSVEVDGTLFIEKENPFCPFYDQEKHLCKIYDYRPFACRIYPLDILLHQVEGDIEMLWWVVHNACPISQDYKDKKELDFFYQYAEQLEAKLPDSLCDAISQQYITAKKLERFFGRTLDYTPIKPFNPIKDKGL